MQGLHARIYYQKHVVTIETTSEVSERIKAYSYIAPYAASKPVARNFRTGVTRMSDLYVCMHKYTRLGGCGGMLPQENLIL